MWIFRSVLALVGGSCLVVLSAALTRTAASVAPATSVISPELEPSTISPAPAPQANADAERCLDRAIELFQADRIQWLEMAIWQKVQLPGFTYEADGFYRLAPGQRFRLEMRTHPDEGEGTFLSVSDGLEMWRAERSAQGTWQNVTHVNLSEVFGLMNGPAGDQLRNEFLQRPHFLGMTHLLRNLRCRMVWASSEMLRRNNGERTHLVGVWSREQALKYSLPNQPWMAGLPRQCHLYLDAHSHWPQRVEWWGPNTAGGADCLQVQMEFRNPVFNRPLPVEDCDRQFAFHPGAVEVEDETGTMTAEVTRRAHELTQSASAR